VSPCRSTRCIAMSRSASWITLSDSSRVSSASSQVLKRNTAGDSPRSVVNNSSLGRAGLSGVTFCCLATLLWRKLNSKAKLESSASYFSFKR